MPISATVPAARRDAANATLEAAGFGPDSFSVPLHQGASPATHYGLHCWADVDGLLATLQALPQCRVMVGSGDAPNFLEHVDAEGLMRMARPLSEV